MDLRIPFATLLKIALTILLVLIVVNLWPVILMLVIAVLIAVVLDPIALWMERFGVRRGFGVALITTVVFGLLILFFAVAVPSIMRQLIQFAHELPQIRQRIVSSFPQAAQFVQQPATAQQMRGLAARGAFAGVYAIEGVVTVIFVLVIAMYLLIEGRRAYQWLLSFAPEAQRKKVDRTAREMNEVALAYMRGNVITSCICAVFVFVVISALHVPVPLLLATIAFIADFVPVVGTIVMTVPAVLLALMVSPLRALMVIGAYLAYHLIENYLIIPRVYGTQMRLSTLTVLVSIAVGGTLQGVIGAVLALPIAAAYPIVERIWLRERLPPDTVAKHEVIEQRAERSPR